MALTRIEVNVMTGEVREIELTAEEIAALQPAEPAQEPAPTEEVQQ